MVFISHFHTIRPDYEVGQKELLSWIAEAHSYASRGKVPLEPLKAQLFKLGLGSHKILKRGVSFPDVMHTNWKEMLIYNLDAEPTGYGFKKRTELFDQIVTQLFERFYAADIPLPSHLIHVTCTGYVAPSGAQKLVASKRGGSIVTHAYHMGCAAAMSALRMAKGFICGEEEVDIVHTELCSLHMNPQHRSLEQLVVETLFGDGSIKYSVSRKKEGWELLALHEELIAHSLECIGWQCQEWGLAMQLSKEVPRVIVKAIDLFLDRLIEKAGLARRALRESGFFAIHPGGIKIIELLSEQLQLKPWQTAHSREIMQSCGNMSSATQPHIWERILNDKHVQNNSYMVSFAFGPGLTISGGVFKKWSG